MPELAEVEYSRKRWDPGMGQKVLKVLLHAEKRIFRGTDIKLLQSTLPGSTLLRSEAGGKQMVFQFSKGLWLGIHLGMTGEMRVEKSDYLPAKHDHLVLVQKKQALVLEDCRQFGRVRFANSKTPPEWWASIPKPLTSASFTAKSMEEFLQRHRKLPIKACLLLQNGFPGVGNWMADEILWRARLNPHVLSGSINGKRAQALWKQIRFVCQAAIRHIGDDWSDVPKNWLFHERWKKAGLCPRHQVPLRRETIGGRTTAWCAQCQE
ncbi:MAG TPA: DNA-formamidopyrimidine glycosylase family protein [Candidatus Saccharimonadales bacterium]|nr:DNA-formamidopyrimidine glycosylase family protein [Candidatus Saccharimonadales bacterium]